jgi:formiminotetrahydrofolate cyclodeaminase
MSVKSLVALKVTDFCVELASDSPAPGGGSASALSGALAASLAGMVARLTIGKKGYEAVSERMKGSAAVADVLREALLETVERDTAAFNAIMEAYRLPKDDPEEKAARDAAVQAATREATMVPLETATFSCQVLELALEVARDGNRNAASDAGVCSLLALAAVKGALLNVRINLPSVKDPGFVSETARRADELEAAAEKMAAGAAAEVKKRISSQ